MNKILKLPYLLLLAAFILPGALFAQLQVKTTVFPPYSPYLSDYVAYNNKVVVMITNPTNQVRQVKLLGNLKGNGISISIPQSFKPPLPITVPNGITNITGAQLEPYFNTSNIDIVGITEQELVQGNGLPEGTYTLCFWAADYNTGQALSPVNQGCATFTISHFEAPFLLKPMCNTDVQELKPQNMMFSWTIPAGANPTKVQYELTIAEMFPQQIDPNQALDVATEPIFFRKIVQINNYVYGQIDPKLEPGKKYAWRVRAMPRPGETLLFKNNGISKACYFNYTAGQQQNQQQQPPPNDDYACIAQCETPEPANKSPYSPQVGDDITLGKFTMKIKTLNGSNGTGIIRIPFLGVNLLVDFSGLQVNTDKVAFGTTKAVAKVDGNNLIDQATANDPNGEIQMVRDKYNSISNYVNQGQRLVSKFTPEMQPVGVPFALDKNGLNLQIVGLIFTPTKAFMNSIYGYDMAEWFGNDFVDFSQKGLCIRPNGFGIAPKFTLKNDRAISISDHAEMKFLKGEGSFVEISCTGIEKVKLSGEYLISRQKLLPVENDKVVDGNARVKAPFTIEATQGANWLANTTLQPAVFTVPDATDLRFTAQNIMLDMHEGQNPNGVVFHAQHPKKAGNNLDWKGLYLGKITVTLPQDFKKSNNKITLEALNLMIDKTGFWGNITANNLMTLEQGTVGNWQFSISSFGLDIQASALAGGSMAGSIRLPIAETGLGYTCALQKGNNGINYQFSASTENELEAKLWVATINLLPGSTVKIEKDNNQVVPSAILNGSISVGFSQSPNQQTSLSKLSLNGINFQELTISGAGVKPSINLKFVALQNQPGGMFNMNKFPINLTQLAYDNGNDPGLIFGLKLNLSKGSNAFEAATDLKISASWNNGQKKFEFKGIELKKITIDADLGVMEVKGSIDIYKEHVEYGTGFRGDIAATLKFASVAINATVQMGKIGDSDPVNETNSNYRYFFIDIGARWGAGGLPIPGVGAVAFYGFGGGIYRNMNRESAAVLTNDKIPDKQGGGTMTPGESRSGVVYKPQKGTFGFMASVTLGTTGEPTSFNADLKLTVQFNTDNFGVTKVVFDGKAYIMGPITDRNKRLLEVGILIESDFEMPMFHAAVTIDGGFNKSALNVTVKASLNMHFEPGMWYIKLGEWTNEDEPWKDPKRIQVDISLGASVAKVGLNFNAYFMMGTDIGELPRSPKKVRDMLQLDGKNDMPKTPDTKVYLGKGFAFGAGIRLDASVSFMVFYADLEFILGGDVLLSKTNATCNGSPDYGINGWYAKGNAFAYLHGDVGMRLKIWGFDGKFSFLAFTAAAQMSAEMPNPNWIKGNFAIQGSVLNGLVEVNTTFGFEIGQKCQWGDGVLDMPLIAEIRPANNEEGSVFEAPQVAFNFATYKPGQGVAFTVKDYSKSKKGDNRTFKIEVTKVELKRGNVNVAGSYHFNNSQNGLTFLPNDELAEKSQHKFTVVATAYELVNGKWVVRQTEEKAANFKTNISPDYIPEENLVSAYPQRGQRYFLPKDEPKGWVIVALSQCNTLMSKKEDKDFTYSYQIRMVNQETKQEIMMPFTCDGKQFSYNTPNNLAKETVYQLQLLRVAKQKGGAANTKYNTKTVYRDLKGNPVDPPQKSGNQINKNVMQKVQNNQNYKHNNNIQGNKIGPMQIKGNTPNGPNMLAVRHNTVKERQITGESQDKILLQYFFRTSRHNTAAEKYGAYSHAGMGEQFYGGNVIISGVNYKYSATIKFPLLQGQENMDIYDAYGYTVENKNIVVHPLARLKLVWGGNGYYNNLNDRIYERRYKGQGNPTSYNFKTNRFAVLKYNYFGKDDWLFSRQPVEAIKVWHPSTEGPIHIGANQEIMAPKGRLTDNEINMAKQGKKIADVTPKNPVLPLNVFLPAVAYMDGVMIYINHRNRCDSDHILNKNFVSCRDAQALPAITNYLSTQWPNFCPYNLSAGQDYKFDITYGFLSTKPYNRIMTFKAN